MKTKKLTDKMINALVTATLHPTGRVTASHGYKSIAPATVRGLDKRGLMKHVSTFGPYYNVQHVYRITEAGREALRSVKP